MQARRDSVENDKKITDDKAIRMTKNARSISATRSPSGKPIQRVSTVLSQRQKFDVKDLEDEENDFIPDSMMAAIREATAVALKMNDRGKTFQANDSKKKVVKTKASPMKSNKIIKSSAPLVSQKPSLSASSSKKRPTPDIHNDIEQNSKDPSFLSPFSTLKGTQNLQEIEKNLGLKLISQTPKITTVISSGVSLSQPRMQRSHSASKYITRDSISKSNYDPMMAIARLASVAVPIVAKARITASNVNSPPSLDHRLHNAEKDSKFDNSLYNNDSTRLKLEFSESVLQSKSDRNAFKETEELTDDENDPKMITPSTIKMENDSKLMSPQRSLEDVSRVRVKARKDIGPRQTPFLIPRGVLGFPYKLRQSSTIKTEKKVNTHSGIDTMNNNLDEKRRMDTGENLSFSGEKLLSNTVSPIKKMSSNSNPNYILDIEKGSNHNNVQSSLLKPTVLYENGNNEVNKKIGMRSRLFEDGNDSLSLSIDSDMKNSIGKKYSKERHERNKNLHDDFEHDDLAGDGCNESRKIFVNNLKKNEKFVDKDICKDDFENQHNIPEIEHSQLKKYDSIQKNLPAWLSLQSPMDKRVKFCGTYLYIYM